MRSEWTSDIPVLVMYVGILPSLVHRSYHYPLRCLPISLDVRSFFPAPELPEPSFPAFRFLCVAVETHAPALAIRAEAHCEQQRLAFSYKSQSPFCWLKHLLQWYMFCEFQELDACLT